MESTHTGSVVHRSMTDRMIGAAKLDIPTYEEVEHDTDATKQAAIVVGIVAVCAAIGNAGQGGEGAISALFSAYLGWLAWAGVTYFIGTRLFDGVATWGELLRTLGFAQAPGVLFVLGIIPILGRLVVLVVGVWMLVTALVAIRQALDVSTGKALLTALLGLVAYIAVAVVLGIIVGVGSLLA